MAGFILIGGLWFGIPALIVLSIAYVVGTVIFALATLPVEVGASRRAVAVLRACGLTDAEESGEVEQVLRSTASTGLTFGTVVALASDRFRGRPAGFPTRQPGTWRDMPRSRKPRGANGRPTSISLTT